MGALGPSQTTVFHRRVCKYHYVHLSPKGSQNVTKIPLKMEPESIKYCFLHILETTRNNNENQCRKGEEMGAQREPKSNLKSLKKGTQNMFFFLWVPLGAFVALWAPRGVPGAHLLVDFCKCSNVFCPVLVVSLLLRFQNVLV